MTYICHFTNHLLSLCTLHLMFSWFAVKNTCSNSFEVIRRRRRYYFQFSQELTQKTFIGLGVIIYFEI